MTDAKKQRILRQHVQTDQLLGVDSVPIGQPITTGKPTPASANPSATTSDSENGQSLVAAPGPEASPQLDRSAKLKILQALDVDEVQGCTKCELCNSRTQTVFGEGDPDANLMFIGEGPGQNEDEQGRPFVGRAGQLLDKMIIAMGLAREQVFIANVVKCRPPQNRTPTPTEVSTCWDYLLRQITTIQPVVIVTLGGPATKTVLETSKGITALRGTWDTFTGLNPEGPSIPVMPTFHPAYLLRSYTAENRGRVWSDLQEVMQRLQGT